MKKSPEKTKNHQNKNIKLAFFADFKRNDEKFTSNSNNEFVALCG
jgi:hypothetical protein